jgi:hypothetical protein
MEQTSYEALVLHNLEQLRSARGALKTALADFGAAECREKARLDLSLRLSHVDEQAARLQRLFDAAPRHKRPISDS